MTKEKEQIKLKLIVMNFLQFFIWGAWLISMGRYMGNVMQYDGQEVGGLFATAGFAAIITPALTGIIADRWIGAERLLSICHLLTGACLIAVGFLPVGTPFATTWLVIFGVNLFFMPTLSLSNTVAYHALGTVQADIVKDFPPIRVWGTIGFIVAMWLVNLFKWMDSPMQFNLGAFAAIALAIYAWTLPAVPHGVKKAQEGRRSLLSILGLDALVLFKNRQMAVFFTFCILLGAALQVTNAYGNMYLDHFKGVAEYADSFAVKYPNILLSLSQISETLFILAIPFFLKRFGIKGVMTMSFAARFLRFGLFGIGDPGMPGIIALVLSMVVYGMAFDFFNISGSMFVDQSVSPSMRASAQGLFLLMTNGLGVVIGSLGAGWVVEHFTIAKVTDWTTVWYIFAGYALVTGVLFLLLFHPKQLSKAQSA
ncbi:nucleoside transporter [Porphyromonas uenonis 60-3]|uniref:Nucleoside transporter n=1 Tax=Porphyromonas uenonis 60-3 TaxID=596327 RepID=C2MDW2_9PORP|nr:nucleoside permease [Porphyromonas uenonis]EEK16098.1 nucleoside transporter [Porphyromonas uenonis 60-3]